MLCTDDKGALGIYVVLYAIYMMLIYRENKKSDAKIQLCRTNVYVHMCNVYGKFALIR